MNISVKSKMHLNILNEMTFYGKRNQSGYQILTQSQWRWRKFLFDWNTYISTKRLAMKYYTASILSDGVNKVERWTKEQYQTYLSSKSEKISKMRNKKVEFDGYTFDSIKEMERYVFLKQMEKEGKIEELELQPRFLITPVIVYDGKKYRKVEYVSDFKYLNKGLHKKFSEGSIVVEDVKSDYTRKLSTYRTKIKQFKKNILDNKYGEYINFIEVN